jgi:hypothetical protein
MGEAAMRSRECSGDQVGPLGFWVRSKMGAAFIDDRMPYTPPSSLCWKGQNWPGNFCTS